jgi:hypothetical protein
MKKMNHSPIKGSRPRSARVWAGVSLLMIVSLACNLPFSKKPEEKILATAPSAAQQSQLEELPPTVVETTPPPGSVLPLQAGIGLTFDQPMERESVEGAIRLEPAYSGRFEWVDEYSVQFISDQPLPPDTPLTVYVAATARARNGKALLRPQEFGFQTAGSLRIAERIPADGTTSVDPQITVAVTFTQPVVPLGENEGYLPEAFNIDPPAPGSGRWLNSSTYLFQPEPGFGGGITYTVRVNPDLVSLAGSRLESDSRLDWSFTTESPRVLWSNPGPGETIWLDSDFTVGFNQPMDRESVEKYMVLLDDQDNVLPGEYNWEQKDTQVAFQPAEPMRRGGQVRLVIGADVRSLGGNRLAEDTVYSFRTVDRLAVVETTPDPGEELFTFRGRGAIMVSFNAPLEQGQDLSELITVTPEPADFSRTLSNDGVTLHLPGFYESGRVYQLTVLESLKDRWGGRMGERFTRSFRTADLEPELILPMLWPSSQVVYLPPGERALQATATNVSSLRIEFARVDPAKMLAEYNLRYEQREFTSEQTWTQMVDLPRNRSQTIEIGLTPDGSTLAPGIYRYRISSPQLARNQASLEFWLVVSRYQLSLKVSKNEIFAWVTDAQSLTVAEGESLTVYDSDYTRIGAGTTDANGTARIRLPDERSPSGYYLVLLGAPGDSDFAAGFTFWDEGIEPWNFGIDYGGYLPELFAYLYTDRPIYRPGQTVYFRGVLRESENTRYSLPDITSVELEVRGDYDPAIEQFPLITTLQSAVSDYGTIKGEFILPEDARPGNYSLQLKEDESALVRFQVAEYRKPEIDLQVNFDQAEYSLGEDLRVEIDAAYFFGAKASDAGVSWTLYARDEYFYLPGGYSTGPLDTSWLQPYWFFLPGNPLGEYLTYGEGRTARDGRLLLTFTGQQMRDLLKEPSPVVLTLEATLTDESGMPVSRRASVRLHPADFYIGVRTDSWGQAAGEKMGFTIQTADWQKQPSGPHTLTAAFQKVVWKQDQTALEMGETKYTREVTLVASSDFQTDASGRARLEFTPETPGTYQLEISGGGALTQILIWIGGAGSAPWPRLPDQRLRLDAERTEYTPGETASIFIPNPYPEGGLALITVERDSVLRSEVIQLTGASRILELEIEEGDAPNIYVSVLVLGSEGGRLDFRQGYLELNVAHEFLELQVDLIPEQTQLEPGQIARAEILVRDSLGRPVQGEFSLAVVDAAIYALAEPNAADIREAFYGQQPLRVRSSTSMAAYNNRIVLPPPAFGGGGGGDVAQPPFDLRETFRDTAFWKADVVTGADGRAQIEFPVPDNLTTWVMTVRGLDRSTRVGERTANLVVSKDLLVRPVTPRFLVAGDRVRLSAVVHNNTDQALEVKVELTAKGVRLDSPAQSAQTIQLTAGSNRRVDWWVSVQSAAQAELIFKAAGGGYQDAATPERGPIPIRRYSTPATFAVNGVMAEGGETLEVVSLPRSYQPTGGELSIELASTLAGSVLTGLKAMDSFPNDFSEPVISRLFANLAVYNLLQETKFSAPDLKAQLQKEVHSGVERLIRLQNNDGGWGWIAGQKSNQYLSSYGLLVMSSASLAGFLVDPEQITKAQEYVAASLYPVSAAKEDYELDRLALAHFALAKSGYRAVNREDLYQVRTRLSPWGQALLAMALADGDKAQTNVLLADLQASAIRSATGAYWQDAGGKWFNNVNPLATTAMVVYALAESDPASALLSEAVRFLSLNRRANGGWDSTYDSAWCILALARVLRVTGDLTGSFAYSASINSLPLASGQAARAATLNPVLGSTGLDSLSAERGNALRIRRDAGPGRLYYRAFLNLETPVASVKAVDKGILIERKYILAGGDCRLENCPALSEIKLGQPSPVILAQLSITVQKDVYNLIVEDFIPAGAEIVNTRLQTSQLGMPQFSASELNPLDIFSDGWGWWFFSSPVIYDDHIRWAAGYLPAGTYILTYRLQPLQAGDFRVMPAHAYAFYFPEIEGRSSGEVFTIKE